MNNRYAAKEVQSLLVNGFENPGDRKIVLEFYCDGLIRQCLENGENELDTW